MRVALHDNGNVLIVVDEYTKLSSVTFSLFRLTLRLYKFLLAETKTPEEQIT